MSRSRIRRFALAALAVVCVVPLVAAPRPLSDAERAAVQTITEYLSRGPAAVAGQLSADSPLRKLPAASLHDEIEARLGPPAGATWELQTVVPALKDRMVAFSVSFPSGLDDSVSIEMVQEGDAWKMRDLRILAQPTHREPAFPPMESATAQDAPAPPNRAIPFALGIVAAALGTGAAFLRKTSSGTARAMLALVALLTAGFIALRAMPREAVAKKEAGPVAKRDDGRLAPLVEMRRQVAGDKAGAQAKPLAGCQGAICRDVAALWTAQANIQQMQLKEAEAVLARFPSPSPIPLAEILRGRIALLKLDESASAVAYEHAVSLGPGRDGLWYEAAEALTALGYEDRAEKYFERLARMGSRDADVYYFLSLFAAGKKEKEEQAVQLLRQGFDLRPIERARIVAAPPLWSVFRKDEALKFIRLNIAEEPQFASAGASTRPMAIPAGADARISGELLGIRIGEGEMLVPGGAALAPAGTPVVDAGAWARAEEERGLAEVSQLTVVARTPGALAQPALRRRFTRAAEALARRNRWTELLDLTQGLTPKSEHVPPEIFFLRNEALQRADRLPEAKQLMTDLASSTVLLRRRDAGALEQLAEALAAHDLFDKAVAMYDRAQAIRANPFVDDRVRQIQMNKRLATRYSVHSTEHFEIHFPEEFSPLAAKQIASIMEQEFIRLKKWVPVQEFKRTVVNVLWWQEFRSTYTGNDFILGFYEGKITVPFAGVQQYVPEVVALLTHELCHAMVGQTTKHQAPRWFQEGLAQRVEMVDYHANAFNMYDDEKLIAVPLFDAVLTGSPDPEMIGGAYIQAQTVIRFIEAEFGVNAVARMIEQYRDGATTEEAILAVTRLTMPEFQARLRTWGRSGSRVFENPAPKRYDVPEGDVHYQRRNG